MFKNFLFFIIIAVVVRLGYNYISQKIELNKIKNAVETVNTTIGTVNETVTDTVDTTNTLLNNAGQAIDSVRDTVENPEGFFERMKAKITNRINNE